MKWIAFGVLLWFASGLFPLGFVAVAFARVRAERTQAELARAGEIEDLERAFSAPTVTDRWP